MACFLESWVLGIIQFGLWKVSAWGAGWPESKPMGGLGLGHRVGIWTLDTEQGQQCLHSEEGSGYTTHTAHPLDLLQIG